MDLTISREPLSCCEILFDGGSEQGVEFDYVLPDYYPDIFKVVRCGMRAGISSYNVSGDKLNLDGAVNITVLYLSENSSKLQCVEHRYTYSKTVDLPKSAEKVTVSIKPKTDYCSCRAVSGRRIDVRGAVSFKIKVTSISVPEIITGAENLGVQVKTAALQAGGKSLQCEKLFAVREEIEAAGGGNVKAVISCDAVGYVNDCKLISDKAVIKGDAKLKALYITDDGETTSAHTMQAEIPISQIIDIEGITEKALCNARLEVLSCDLSYKSSNDDGTVIFGCEMTVGAYVTASKPVTVYPVIDLYSTDYEVSYETMTLRTETNPVTVSGNQTIKETVTCTDGEISSVTDCRCEVIDTVCKIKSGEEMIISGKAIYSALVSCDNIPVFIEKSAPFEVTIPTGTGFNADTQYSADVYVGVGNTSFSMTDDRSVEIRAGIVATGCVYTTVTTEVIRDITVDKNAEKQKDGEYPLKLYFMQENEDIWSIAKRYNTSAAAVEAENQSDNEALKNILLIPIV